ncbi:hypothetical protein [Gloeothece verrucosa]|uniref:Uncharacterized protein n=1 Tax=Gloeothece verrucosa (strain PCC 7822) TaxID=497965 RepID=E0U693_GLOV7|nr:hypothetical protein [Gloeothece verrucosa]ADN12429.1 hypothetical protein Cyan7822_0384 [Gloeothece verrucosa PCC 7822]
MFTGLELMSLSLVNEVEVQEESSHQAAEALGDPIELKNNNLVEQKREFKKIDPLELQSNPSNDPSLPLVVTTPQVNQQKPEEINGVFSQLKFDNFQSSLTLNSGSLKSSFALPLGLTWYLELRGSQNNLTEQPNWTSTSSFSLKKFIDWFHNELSNAQETSQSSSPHGLKVIVPNDLKFSQTTWLNLNNFTPNEIDQTPDYLRNLNTSAKALSNRRISQEFNFSWDANLNNVSLGFTSPLPGFLNDELEVRNNSNISEIIINHFPANEPLQGTVSLKYRIAIDKNMKLELHHDHNLNNNSNTTFVRWVEKY